MSSFQSSENIQKKEGEPDRKPLSYIIYLYEPHSPTKLPICTPSNETDHPGHKKASFS